MVEVLGGLGDLGFGLDGLLQRADGGVWRNLEREEVAIVRGSRNCQGDTPVLGFVSD